MQRKKRRFAYLEFRGPDAAAFLQGYLTADLDKLRSDVASPMAYCNLKGRVVADGWASGDATGVRLLLHESVMEDFAADLGKYLLFAKAKLIRPDAGLRFSPTPVAGSVELPPTGYFAAFDASSDAGHEDFANACAEVGFVVVERSVSAAFLPQMIGLTERGAVSFAKGCYLGQEVVARAEHRGAVKQTLRRYRFDGEPPNIGATVMDGERKIGTVVATGTGFALAATRSEAGSVAVGKLSLALAD